MVELPMVELTDGRRARLRPSRVTGVAFRLSGGALTATSSERSTPFWAADTACLIYLDVDKDFSMIFIEPMRASLMPESLRAITPIRWI